MIAPFAHRAGLAEMTAEERHELADMAAAFETRPAGHVPSARVQRGLNLGRSAGAGRRAPRSPARRPALGRRHELPHRPRGHAHDPRRPADDAGPPRGRVRARFVTKRPREAALLALVAAAFPGVGHVFLGQRARGAAFCTIVLLTAATGLAPRPEERRGRPRGVRPHVPDRRGHHAGAPRDRRLRARAREARVSLLHDHFLLLVWLAGLFSAFLALLWKDEPRARGPVLPEDVRRARGRLRRRGVAPVRGAAVTP